MTQPRRKVKPTKRLPLVPFKEAQRLSDERIAQEHGLPLPTKRSPRQPGILTQLRQLRRLRPIKPPVRKR
ncbi:hypothetical protein LCGC14_0926990 [marine sediment metagenome]|uniref:Uncharacterized protein n=1 Tax=marine sediment metagenome TaxID=412755 RepID=A0A0F9RVU2_9ZZZZ